MKRYIGYMCCYWVDKETDDFKFFIMCFQQSKCVLHGTAHLEVIPFA